MSVASLDELRDLVLSMTPAQLEAFTSHLDAADVALVEQVYADARSAHWRADPARMALHFEPERFKDHAYFLHLGQKFRQLVDGSDRFQIWEVPAQHGKSSIASQYGPAWALDLDPSQRLLCTTYGDDLAERNGLAIRDILLEHADVLRARLRRDQSRKDRFLTPEGGGVLSAGLFALGSGWSATGAVVDDPYKGWEQAHSAAQRQKVWDAVRSGVWMRQADDDFWMLVCTTRWHQADIVPTLLEQLGEATGVSFTVVRLAQFAEEPDLDSPDPTLRMPDPLGRPPGQHLGRFSLQSIATKRALMGEYLFAGMEQQRPAPAAGTEVLREWFQIEDTLPPKPDQAIASWDLKQKDKEAGDYVVGQLWWRVGGGYWLMDQLRGQWNNATVKAAMALMVVRHPEVGIQYFENAGNAPELTAELRRGDPAYEVSDYVADKLAMTEAERIEVQALLRHGLSSLVPVVPKGDKSVRMRSVSPVIEGRNVHLPAGALWLPLYLDEVAAFPNGANDDQVDATSQALSKLSRGAATATPATGQLPTPGLPSAAPPPGPAARAPAAGRQRASIIAPRGRVR